MTISADLRRGIRNAVLAGVSEAEAVEPEPLEVNSGQRKMLVELVTAEVCAVLDPFAGDTLPANNDVLPPTGISR